MKYAIGLDLGGTEVKAVLVDPQGEIVERVSRSSHGTDERAGEAWKEAVHETLHRFAPYLEAGGTSIGVAAPGLAAPDGRSIAVMPGRLPGLERLDWTEFLAQPRMVPVLNDAQAALLGEAWRGAAVGFRHAFLLTLGTGVGGAILSDGRVLKGALGRAGHFGHVSIGDSPERSVAGTPGALELAIGNCTILHRSGGRYASTLALIEAHRAGDKEATRIWTDSVRVLGRALVGFINVLDPEAVIVGGGIAHAADDLFGLLAQELDKFEWRPGGHRVQILPAALGEWAGALGAARNAFDHDALR